MITPLILNFPEGGKQFVGQMLGPDSEGELREWVLIDIASAPSQVVFIVTSILLIITPGQNMVLVRSRSITKARRKAL